MSLLFVAVHCATAGGRPVYVDANASQGGGGSSWTTAYKYLQDALADANADPDANNIWVAVGVYTPDTNSSHPNGTGDRTARFQLINDVGISGGFPSGGDPNWNDRDPNVYETILSGDLNGNDVGDANRGENSYRIATSTGTDSSATLDGFTITAGNANGPWPHTHGAGLFNSNSSAKVTNCIFSGNSANTGGGMYNANSSPTVIGCTFIGNSVVFPGGGMSNWNSSPILTNCTFTGNSAKYGGGISGGWATPITNCTFTGNTARRTGGGIAGAEGAIITNCTFRNNSARIGGGIVTGWSVVLTNCTFIGNSADRYGGGMLNTTYDGPTVSNCTFTGNSANYDGGGMYNGKYSSPTVTGCTFTGNSADRYGGGMYNLLINSLTVSNCILWGDAATSGGNEIYNYDSTPLTSYCDIAGCLPGGSWDTSLGSDGGGNIDEDPCFADPGYWGDANDPNIVVEPNDPNAVWVAGDYHLLPDSPCINAGDPNYVPDPNEKDIDGQPRLWNGRIDMGADEFVPPVECSLRFTPRVLNLDSRGRWVKAHLVLPQGFGVDDVDTGRPLVIQPMGIESQYVNVFVNDDGTLKVKADFERADFCNSGPFDGTITVEGQLVTGRPFYGTAAVKVKDKSWERIASLAPHWLRTDCGAPDWCDGLDLNRDSTVNFMDFAAFDACCVEFPTQ